MLPTALVFFFFFFHVVFPYHDDLFYRSSKKKVSWQDKYTHNCVCPITFATFYMAKSKQLTLKRRESHRMWTPDLGATLWVLHNNLEFIGKTLIVARSLVGTFPCGTHFLLIWFYLRLSHSKTKNSLTPISFCSHPISVLDFRVIAWFMMFRFLYILIWKVTCEIIKAVVEKDNFYNFFHRDLFQECILFNEHFIIWPLSSFLYWRLSPMKGGTTNQSKEHVFIEDL